MANHIAALAENQRIATNSIVDGFRTLAIDAAKQTIPLFTGELDGPTFHDWIEKADRVAVANTWTDAEKLRIFQERLARPASAYNDGLPANQKDTLGHWREHFALGFNDALFVQNLATQLDQLKQKKSERVRDFVARIDDLYRQVYGAAAADDAAANVVSLRNATKRTIMLNGLNREIYEQMWSRINPAAGWDEVRAAAEATETILVKKREGDTVAAAAVAVNQQSKIEENLKKITKLLEQLEKLSGRDTL